MAHRHLGTIAKAGVLAVSLLLVLAGCGSNGGPSTAKPDGPQESQFFLDLSGGVGPDVQGRTGHGTARVAPEPPASSPTSFTVDGSVGAELVVGRFTLLIPAGAFEGSRQITVEDANNGFVECHLYPEGLQFDVPVTLTMDLSGSSADRTDATIYWLDKRADFWVDLGGTYVTADHKVWVKLAHFSEYRGGRAGW
jgi:hypothetical protein